MTKAINERQSSTEHIQNTVKEMESKSTFIGVPIEPEDKDQMILLLRKQLLESSKSQEKSKEQMASLRLQLLSSREENKKLVAKCEQSEARINKLYDLNSKYRDSDSCLLRTDAAIQEAAHIRVLQKQTALANMNVTYH
ncbi:E3 ubiquitin-protein ligase HECTD [Acrasis kona]|uniref:E3 ubiquitin-protein ligase HECTD n=1 Tax=Acrasis kona TaxID=1008807 RepID=A0AAW2YPV3_9EUKA